MNYNVYLLDDVSFEINKLRRYKNKIYDFFNELKENPFLERTSQKKDKFGNIFDVSLIGKHYIYYYTDHANKEIKVISLLSCNNRYL